MTQGEALEILKLGHNAFITGAAGSGKTHLINEYINYLKGHGVEVGITASTGIAATHIGGTTIHAWTGLGVRDKLSPYDLEDLEAKPYLWKRLSRAEVLIIDEVSMLHDYRLDMIEAILRSFKRIDEPFGGIQVIFCGDFCQLPPVTKAGEAGSFAYRAGSWQNLGLKICYLEEQHRQQDKLYLSILNAIRDNDLTPELGEHLQGRLGKKINSVIPTKLYTHNVDVDAENERELAKIPNEVYSYNMAGHGGEKMVENLKKGCLASENLRLKKGARVMFVKNNIEEGYANGTLGEVVSCDRNGIVVKTSKGKNINVPLASWRIEEDGKIKAEISQYPLRLAWAITVHKSQGLSLDAAEIDLSQAFEAGMGYVALSRVRTLAGLSLKGLGSQAFRVNEDVLRANDNFREESRRHTHELSGLTKTEKEAKQKRFLAKIGAIGEDGKKAKVKKLTTVDKTRLLVEAGKTLHEMARERELSIDTILDHLEKIKEQNPDLPLQYLSQNMMVSRAKKIRAALTKNGTITGGKYLLGPAKNILGPGFSYDEIRLVRLLM
ncbi:MAG: AAA family ATPase [Candidatus Paceibacterota bacterium]